MFKRTRETTTWNKEKGNFLVLGNPSIIMSSETFVRMQKGAEEMLGFDGAAVLYYEAGKKSGENWIKRFSEEWGLENQRFIEAVQNHFADVGWGKFSIINGDEIVVRVKNSFISNSYGESDRPVCHFLRGYNAGLAGAISGRSIDSEEVRCAAKGDDWCEFVMTYID